MKTMVLLDGNSLMHRSYHGVNKGFIPMHEGMPIGMVYGFASTLLHIVSYFRPEVLKVTFDTKEKTFRHEMDTEYKAHREKAPDDFYAQIPYLYEMLEAFGVDVLKLPGYESDDIIGTLATKADKKDFDIKILSGDLDFLQLVSDHVSLVKFGGKIEDSIPYGPKETFARYEITPEQMIDFKAITGDSSDNYKGIEGVGPKTASRLLNEWKSLDGIYKHLNSLPEKLQAKFRDQEEYVRHCQKLAAIHTDVPVEISFGGKFALAQDSGIDFLEKMRFHSLKNRYSNMNNNFDHNSKREQRNESKKIDTEEQMTLF